MKYEDMKKCITIAEGTCSSCGMRIYDANISLVNYQDGANGKIKQKLCFAFEYDYARISFEITPKGGE